MAKALRATNPIIKRFIDDLGKIHAGSRADFERLSGEIEEEMLRLSVSTHERQHLLQAYVRACGVLAIEEVPDWMRKAYLAIEGRRFSAPNIVHLV